MISLRAELVQQVHTPEKSGVLVLVAKSTLVAGENGFHVKAACGRRSESH